MTMLNTCKCGGEVYIRYEMEPILGTHYTAVCEECGAVYPLKVDNKLDAVREWNGCKGVGEIQMTNEDWFDTLTTEEKAKIIVCLAVNSMHKRQKGLIDSDVGEIVRWLKAKHNSEEK